MPNFTFLHRICDNPNRKYDEKSLKQCYTAKFAQLAASLSSLSGCTRIVATKPHIRCVRSACCGLTILARISTTTDLLQFDVDRHVAMAMTTDLLQIVVNRPVAMAMKTDLQQFDVDRAAAMAMIKDLQQVRS